MAIVSYNETVAIQAFLGYLNKHWSSRINARDSLLIAAVSAWFHQESGGIKSVIGNNPFNIRPGMTSFLSNGYRVSTQGNGKFLTFASMSRGFEAAAYLLIHGSKTYGYQTAINGLRKGGNQGATDFLAALAASSWDAAHYGTHNWADAYNPKKNHLLRNYLAIGGVRMEDPNPDRRGQWGKHRKGGGTNSQTKGKPSKPAKPIPELPRDFNFRVVPNNFIDPYAAGVLYANRHSRTVTGQTLDGTPVRS